MSIARLPRLPCQGHRSPDKSLANFRAASRPPSSPPQAVRAKHGLAIIVPPLCRQRPPQTAQKASTSDAALALSPHKARAISLIMFAPVPSVDRPRQPAPAKYGFLNGRCFCRLKKIPRAFFCCSAGRHNNQARLVLARRAAVGSMPAPKCGAPWADYQPQR